MSRYGTYNLWPIFYKFNKLYIRLQTEMKKELETCFDTQGLRFPKTMMKLQVLFLANNGISTNIIVASTNHKAMEHELSADSPKEALK